MQGLSAGRVQSVALRLVVDREKARIAHTSAEYWDLEATVDPGTFSARLQSIDGKTHRAGQRLRRRWSVEEARRRETERWRG